MGRSSVIGWGMASSLDTLAASRYISLTTFRRDGTPVATPVWLVREADALLVTTQGSSGKAKRIRNNPQVSVAPCNARGRTTGEAVPAVATLLGPEETARVTRLVSRRYGLLGWLLTRRGDAADRVGISIVLD